MASCCFDSTSDGSCGACRTCITPARAAGDFFVILYRRKASLQHMSLFRFIFLLSVPSCRSGQRLQPVLLRIPCSRCWRKTVTPATTRKLKSGDLNLEAFTSAEAVSRNREKWDIILRRLEAGEMPPKGVPRPDPDQLKTATAWIQSEFDRDDTAMKPEAGRVTARRLNRSEYNNTIRDLLGVDINPAKGLSAGRFGVRFRQYRCGALALSGVDGAVSVSG